MNEIWVMGGSGDAELVPKSRAMTKRAKIPQKEVIFDQVGSAKSQEA